MAQELTIEQQRAVAIASARLRLQQQQQGQAAETPKPRTTDATDPSFWQIAMDPKVNPILNRMVGAGKSIGEHLQTAGQWLEHITGQQVSPPRTTPVPQVVNGVPQGPPGGRDVFAASNSQQEYGKNLATLGTGIAAAGATGGASLPVQVGVGGMTGAMLTPDNPYLGGTLGMAAPMVSSAINALPNASRAGANFQQVMGKAKDVPLNLGAADDVALRARELRETGATLPKVIRDYIKARESAPTMTYGTGRDFASNAGALSARETTAMTPAMKAQVNKLAAALKDSNRTAAQSVGMGQVYDDAMREYGRAMSQKKAYEAIVKALKKYGVQAAIGTGVGYGTYKALAE